LREINVGRGLPFQYIWVMRARRSGMPPERDCRNERS